MLLSLPLICWERTASESRPDKSLTISVQIIYTINNKWINDNDLTEKVN